MPRKTNSLPARVTLGDIARVAKVHHSTVSRALRNHHSIPQSSRIRIQQLAQKLGYRPDPMLAALAAYRKTRARVTFQSALGWLTNFPDPDGWRYRQIMSEYLDGARSRAEQIGFAIDMIDFHSLSLEGKNVPQILLARGIRGLLLPPQPAAHSHMHLPWNEFAGVSFGFSLTRPLLHSVSNYQYGSVLKLSRHLVSLGFKRPALVYSGHSDERLNFSWSAGFRSALTHLKIFHKTLLYVPPKLQKDAFLHWFDRTQPDVLIIDGEICFPNNLADCTQNHVFHWLTDAGLKIPNDVSLAVLALPSAERFFGGISENAEEMGAAAVDLLTGCLQRGEFGPPRLPFRLSVEGSYRPGPSIRPHLKARP